MVVKVCECIVRSFELLLQIGVITEISIKQPVLDHVSSHRGDAKIIEIVLIAVFHEIQSAEGGANSVMDVGCRL